MNEIKIILLGIGLSISFSFRDFNLNVARANHLDGNWYCTRGESGQGGQLQGLMEAQLNVRGDYWQGKFQHIGYGQFNAEGVIRTGPADNGGEFVIFQATNSSNPQAIGLANFGVAMQNPNFGRSDGRLTEICQRS